MGRIVESDIPKILAMLKDVVGTDACELIARMGGLTNHTYHTVLEDGREYVVRIPGDGTEEMINRNDEKISTTLACKLEIDAQMLYFGDDGSKVTEYIPDAVTMSGEAFHNKKWVEKAAELFRRIHDCGEDTGVPFEVFDMAAGYEKIIRDMNVALPQSYEDQKAIIFRIKEHVDEEIHPVKVPCHNDPLCENWVTSGERLYLIDWEYAGMNDGMWDVSDISIEAEFDAEWDKQLLTAYLGHEPSPAENRHFLANKIYVDYLWTLWALTRVPFDGQPMQDWADERWARMLGNIEEFEKIN